MGLAGLELPGLRGMMMVVLKTLGGVSFPETENKEKIERKEECKGE
jgi:hypothetical protein